MAKGGAWEGRRAGGRAGLGGPEGTVTQPIRLPFPFQNKGKLLDFYKERAQQFYDGHVEELTFRNSGDLVRRKTNLLVKRQTRGRVQEYMRGASLALRPPLAAFGANIFEVRQ